MSSIDETFRFTSSNEDDRKDWYSKLTGKYLKTLQKGAEDYREQCRRERGEAKVEDEEEELKEGDGDEEGEGYDDEEGKDGEEEEEEEDNF